MGIPRSHLVRILLTCCFLICSAFSTQAPLQSVQKRVGVVFIMHSSPYCSSLSECLPKFPQELQDNIKPPRLTATQYVGLLNSTITDYFNEATYNYSHLSFEAVLNPMRSDGWFEAPHKLSDYNDPERAHIIQDGVDIAASIKGFGVVNYDILLVVQNIQSLYGYTSVIGGLHPGEYETIPIIADPDAVDIWCESEFGMVGPCSSAADPAHLLNIGLATVGENIDNESFLEVVAHEFGHLHGLPHVVMGPYDIIGNSEVLTHFGGWSKAYAGWLTGITDMPCIQGPCEVTTQLKPLEYKGNNLLRMPFVNMPFQYFIGYLVECRAQTGYDTKLPKAGVVISSVDGFSNLGEPTKIVFPFGGNDYANAALSPGETFVDEVRKITITYLSKNAYNDCTVKATRGEISAPDPLIRGSETAILDNGGLNHDSIDIWMDSEQNGWGTYPLDTQINPEGSPIGIGDPFWVNHTNRIMFRVRNHGYGTANNVRVNIFVRQPLKASLPSINCPRVRQGVDKLVGTVVIDHLDVHEVYLGFVPWTPSETSSALVTVVIEDYVGEITHANNIAKETYPGQLTLQDVMGNVSSKDTTTSFVPETIKVEVEKNCKFETPYSINRFVVGDANHQAWEWKLSRIQGEAGPDEPAEIEIRSVPPENAKAGDCGETGIMVSGFMDDIYEPVETFSFRSCVVEISEITCQTGLNPIDLGKEVSITGDLSPKIDGAAIALEFTNPGGETIINNVTLNKAGEYLHKFKADKAGKWKVQAFWQGDDRSSPAESKFCYFTVKGGDPKFTLESNANCRSGPGMDYPVSTSGRKGDVIDIEARDPNTQWLYGKMMGARCWVYIGLGSLNVDPSELPVRQPPPKPTPTVSASACQMYTTQPLCLRHKDTCLWILDAAGKGTCQVK